MKKCIKNNIDHFEYATFPSNRCTKSIRSSSTLRHTQSSSPERNHKAQSTVRAQPSSSLSNLAKITNVESSINNLAQLRVNKITSPRERSSLLVGFRPPTISHEREKEEGREGKMGKTGPKRDGNPNKKRKKKEKKKEDKDEHAADPQMSGRSAQYDFSIFYHGGNK